MDEDIFAFYTWLDELSYIFWTNNEGDSFPNIDDMIFYFEDDFTPNEIFAGLTNVY